MQPKLKIETDMKTETVSCPFCSGTDYTALVVSTDKDAPAPQTAFTVVRCLACDLCFTNPRPTPELIGRFYRQDYAPYQNLVGDSQDTKRWAWLRRINPLRSTNYERGDFPLIGQQRLLDFGCGAGAFLLQMRQLGWNVIGLDTSEAIGIRLKEKYGLHVLIGTLPNPALTPESFDLITFWHSLEHVHQPLHVLYEVNRLLTSGGKLLVAVPNIASASFRWFGPNWFGLDVPRHLTHFSPRTLRKMFEKAGFVFELQRMTQHSFMLRQSAERAICHGKASMTQAWLRKRFISSAVSRGIQWVGAAENFMMIARKP
jgi:2-polyprenyl-3-methyl-5-hydroxy-6-metoxy-1,4-benzoquinol methylase